MKPNIILWDLETLPDMAEVMKVFPSIGMWPGRTFKSTINSIICFGYKRLGEDKAQCINAWDFDQEHPNDDAALVAVAYEILKDADCIVTHNGKKFDVKVLNTRLLKYGYPPLPKIPHADTKVIAKRINLYSNKLGDVSKFLGGESKLENGGWNLWVEVMNGDKNARKLMTEYCKQDVEVLEQVYNGLRPLMKNSELPNHNRYIDGEKIVCGTCGSDHIKKNGVRKRVTGDLQMYLCNNCGSYTQKKINSKAAATPMGA